MIGRWKNQAQSGNCPGYGKMDFSRFKTNGGLEALKQETRIVAHQVSKPVPSQQGAPC